jgi:hypothetical protein
MDKRVHNKKYTTSRVHSMAIFRLQILTFPPVCGILFMMCTSYVYECKRGQTMTDQRRHISRRAIPRPVYRPLLCGAAGEDDLSEDDLCEGCPVRYALAQAAAFLDELLAGIDWLQDVGRQARHRQGECAPGRTPDTSQRSGNDRHHPGWDTDENGREQIC